MSTGALLELKDVHKSFGPKQVLKGVNLDVAPGKSLVILGGSGSGKSVMLKNALGLMTPNKGQIIFNGEDVTHDQGKTREAMRARIGMLFQSGALFDSLTVWENIAFRLLNSDGLKRKEAKERAIETLKQVRLGADVADLTPAEISGGMQKRVGLARAIVSKPDLINNDEPTTVKSPTKSPCCLRASSSGEVPPAKSIIAAMIMSISLSMGVLKARYSRRYNQGLTLVETVR